MKVTDIYAMWLVLRRTTVVLLRACLTHFGRITARQLEGQLKHTLLELKTSRASCEQLLQEREDSEKEILSELDRNKQMRIVRHFPSTIRDRSVCDSPAPRARAPAAVTSHSEHVPSSHAAVYANDQNIILYSDELGKPMGFQLDRRLAG
ncbi:hypothetical protein EVAR_3233_1 [Eumeta japonica]|uniref:Uncharacterized protein n=1 Tax=Eumeta variegata TaxID=151549 RepID=A0A4C1SY71_EUMVA|nr:hypothetical protein EVAR_3233_1 [Eumeta japonica]